ncbi:MAG: phytanoyl-CoA dioxygenase family protein [Acidimicrobiales bacterium]
MLTPAQHAEWEHDGWLVLRDALDADHVARITGWVDEVAAWADLDGGPGLHHRELADDGPVLARTELFADAHDGLGSLLRTGLIVEVLAELFGEAAVLFKEKVNYKHAGGGGFAPHQDAAAYRFVDHHISVAVPVDAATVASGCLWFAPGHGAGMLPTDARGCIADDIVAELSWRPVELEPGDIVFFDSYAPHRSETNTSGHSRRTLYLTYNAATAGDLREQYYADKLAEFARVGDTVDGERVRISVIDDFLGRPVA